MMNTHPSQMKSGSNKLKKYIARRKQIDTADIELGCVAEIVAHNLFDAIMEFQNSLPNEQDVVIQAVKFNESITILVSSLATLVTI